MHSAFLASCHQHPCCTGTAAGETTGEELQPREEHSIPWDGRVGSGFAHNRRPRWCIGCGVATRTPKSRGLAYVDDDCRSSDRSSCLQSLPLPSSSLQLTLRQLLGWLQGLSFMHSELVPRPLRAAPRGGGLPRLGGGAGIGPCPSARCSPPGSASLARRLPPSQARRVEAVLFSLRQN